jgi:hypothetical protein
MRKLVISDYIVEGQTFEVRPSIAAVLFNEEKLNGREIIRRDELATRVENCKEDSILLEEVDWNRIVGGLNASDLKPLGRTAVEFVKRVLDAPIVEVTEKTNAHLS